MKISPARIAAFDVLMRIERERAFSSELLPIYEDGLSANDAALCHRLTLGVLRSQIPIDYLIEQLAPGKKLDTAVRIALRIGIFQLRSLSKIPDHSAVNESVNLVGRAKKASAKGFVNAILRRAARETASSPHLAATADRISFETSHPKWLIEKWIAKFGADETENLAAANNRIPRVAFRLTANADASTDFDSAEPSKYAAGCFVSERGSGELRAAAESGEIYFQDEGSQMVGDAVELAPVDKFLDLCAAPGSKFTQIATSFAGSGRLLVAGDRHEHRVRFMSENCRQQGIDTADLVQYDAETGLPFADEVFDAVLVDAPCSGTGTIRHNPELRYFLEPGDFAALAKKQLKLLQNASKVLRVGGKLIYSTCSLEPEENEGVCEMLLASTPGLEKAKISVPKQLIGIDGFARTVPHRHDMDGFFIAAFEKTAS